MFGFDDAQQAHQDVYGQDGQPDNQATYTGEALGGAAGFEAMRQYEKHEEANGKPQSHALAKEVLAGFAGVEADRLIQTKGENFYDREKVQRQARENASNYYDQKYQGGGNRDGDDRGGNGGYDDDQRGGDRGDRDQQGGYGRQDEGYGRQERDGY